MTKANVTGVGVVWGDLVASVEGRGSLVDVDGFSDLPREPLVLSHQDLGVIHGVQ